jgi:glycerol-3-phosphate dehydrogenase
MRVLGSFHKPYDMKNQREKQLQSLQEDTFDILVIGGGATGSGIALDAATRGYKVALVEGEDFASGTSSRSTKLIHGGVRYLEDAIKHLNINQFNLVKEALHERTTLLKIAPHLTRLLPIFIPAYSLWQKWYYGIGMKIYEVMSGSHTLKHSRFISKEESLKLFPELKPEGLKGGIIYYDGQFDDARMNISIILTAISHGAAIANYVSVIKLNKTDGIVTSATVKDHFTGKEWDIKARAFVNATGPFVDEVRQLDDPKVTSLIEGSAGSHIIIDKHFCPHDTGLLIPKTSDGRVIFFLPWEGSTLVGTTDIAAKISHNPMPTDGEIQYIIDHINRYLKEPITKSDILSTWSGIRPLVRASDVKDTSHLSRDFKIDISPSRLYSILGGKWTSYRRMGSELIDTMIKNDVLDQKGPCVTDHTPLIGANPIDKPQHAEFDDDILNHLLHSYGDRACEVINIAQKGYGKRLAEGYPYIEAEAIYAARHEYACTEMDILSRRTRLYTLDQQAAEKARRRVSELMEYILNDKTI